MKVSQFHAKNQFLIMDGSKQTFQSYDSVIAVTEPGKQTVLDEKYWDWSRTTGKYRNMFLGEGIAETRKKIDNGTYQLANLNDAN